MANMSNLEYYIVTYKRNPMDEFPVCNIFDFYNTYMKGLKPDWYRDFGPKSQKVLCFHPNHADAAPSMGSFKEKRNNIYLYHCFGCNAHGNVVDMYILYNYYRVKQYIDRDTACKNLASLYGIELTDEIVAKATIETSDKAHNNILKNINSLVNTYTVNDYNRALLNSRRQRKGTVDDLDNLSEDSIFYIAYLRGMFKDTYAKKELVDEEPET